MSFNYRKKGHEFILLFITRIIRMFSLGMLSAAFSDNLFFKGISNREINWIRPLVVYGDVLFSLILVTQADRIGRRKTLIIASLSKLLGGLVYSQTDITIPMIIFGTMGAISVFGGQTGPFMAIEQSALSQLVEECTITPKQAQEAIVLVFSYYSIVGYLSHSFGVLSTTLLIKATDYYWGWQKEEAIQGVVIFYAFSSLLLFFSYYMMNGEQIEAKEERENRTFKCLGVRAQNIGRVGIMGFLFILSNVTAAYVTTFDFQYYYERKYHFYLGSIAGVLFVCSVLSVFSGVLSSKLVRRVGTIATMALSNIPYIIIILLIPMATHPQVSVFLLLLWMCISQMDVPSREAYLSTVLPREERTAANGIVNIITRLVWRFQGPQPNRISLEKPASSLGFSSMFLVAGGLKIIYDIIIGIWYLRNRKTKIVEQNKMQMSELMQRVGMKSEDESK